MKTKLVLGNSVKDNVYTLLFNSLESPVYYTVDYLVYHSVKSSVRGSILDSLYSPLDESVNISIRWRIEL